MTRNLIILGSGYKPGVALDSAPARIHYTETMRPGFLREAPSKTAGQIPGCFSQAVESLDDTNAAKVRLQALASKFAQFVDDRNSLMHGNPHTAQTGEQRLLYDGRYGRRDWTIELIKRFSAPQLLPLSKLVIYSIMDACKVIAQPTRDRSQPSPVRVAWHW